MSLKDSFTKIGGDLSFSYFSISDTTHHLHILMQNKENPVTVCALLLQHKPVNHDKTDPSSIFIEGLDTTGNFKPRIYQSLFTKTFVVSILKMHNPSHLSCFAYPKQCIIFGNSDKNILKKYLDAKNLCEYWIKIFKEYNKQNKLYVYSNYYPTKTQPYTNNDKILLFNDDPINKLSDHIKQKCSVDEIFEILQYKSDFSKGSLIYSISNKKTKNETKSYENTNLKEMLDFLRQTDFTNKERNIESTKEFVKRYDIHSEWFKTDAKAVKKEERKEIKKEETAVLVLKTRKTK